MNRVLSVARIHSTAWAAFVWPPAIMATSFLLNVALFAVIGDQIPGTHFTGGLSSIYVVQLVVASQMVAQFFSFAVGLGATRRAFYLGTGLVVLAQSLAFSVGIYVLMLIEHATNGWGVRLGFFDPIPLTHSGSPVQILVYFVPMLLVSVVGMFLGVVAKRWGSNGIFTLSLGTLVLLGGASVLITWAGRWTAVAHWFADQPGLTLTAGWTLIPLVVLAYGAYGLLRRATP
jgi:hypothetical protein